MRKVFVSYADSNMAWSLKRIGRQARRAQVFDEVLLYTPDSLPQEVISHPLMSYPRGAGLWYWKPNIIKTTLERFPDSIVVYCDAGSSIRKSFVWGMLFRAIEEYDTICFRYDLQQPKWGKWGAGTSEMFHWTKKEALDFFDNYFGDTSYRSYRQISGGLLFMKNKDNALLDEWLNLMRYHPELIIDPSVEEIASQHKGYAGHRHDQVILSALAPRSRSTLILPDTSEDFTPDAFVHASRIRAKDRKEGYLTLAKHWLRRVLKDDTFEALKRIAGVIRNNGR